MNMSFREQLRSQRWDDHRYYHHSRINQSLHFVSAFSFLVAYVLLFVDPVAAALIGWLVSMTTRQAGHFFFEPKGYDHVNQATHGHKEDIKVGYNLNRKIVLMAIWALSPLVLFLDPTLFGVFTPWTSPADFMRLVFQDLDPEAACASGRVHVQGDVEQVIRLFRSLAPR